MHIIFHFGQWQYCRVNQEKACGIMELIDVSSELVFGDGRTFSRSCDSSLKTSQKTYCCFLFHRYLMCRNAATFIRKLFSTTQMRLVSANAFIFFEGPVARLRSWNGCFRNYVRHDCRLIVLNFVGWHSDKTHTHTRARERDRREKSERKLVKAIALSKNEQCLGLNETYDVWLFVDSFDRMAWL